MFRAQYSSLCILGTKMWLHFWSAIFINFSSTQKKQREQFQLVCAWVRLWSEGSAVLGVRKPALCSSIWLFVAAWPSLWASAASLVKWNDNIYLPTEGPVLVNMWGIFLKSRFQSLSRLQAQKKEKGYELILNVPIFIRGPNANNR